MRGPVRLAHVVSHPVPYFAPLYRELARRPAVDLTVFFYSDATLRTYHDREFGRSVEWDTPLLSGYRWRLLPSALGAPLDATALRRPHWDIARAIALGGYDALWAHGYQHLATWLAVAAARARRMRVLVRDEQTLLHRRPATRRALKALALRALFSQASALYIGHQNRRHFAAYGVPRERMHFAPYCVDNNALRRRAGELRPRRRELRARFGVEGDAPVVLFAGKLIAKKQPLRLIEAFARVRREHRASLLIAGEGPLRADAEALVARLSVPDVRFAGFLNASRLPEAYAAADIFVLPSALHETWGLVVNEAQNFALPVVVSDKVGCAADLVPHGEAGFVVPHDDTAALARAIATLVGDPALRARLGERGRTIVERYSITAAADGIVAACLATTEREGAWRQRERLAA